MSSKELDSIKTDLQKHHSWERIGASTNQEKNAVLTIIYEVFTLVVRNIHLLGITQDTSVDGAVRIILKSKTQRNSLRAAFVATRFLTRLPANVKGTRKLALKQEMYRLLERYMDLMKNTY
ncbi:uncharacterized protein N7496_001040 [Penicillium cataractarum]|uniref:Uncharacterized protein n=1 Tax=Penicillium cataractarum TaxID=2100454 RepID=A0A9W9VV63_9EURO|nr:uncharacterized protein N7496_001040 [Penicillium cataractarum]KAJ5389972.1 hypothetical protein N7496_001040 [Penicillium cataractarum]